MEDNMKTTLVAAAALAVAFIAPAEASAQSAQVPANDHRFGDSLAGAWTVGIGFGEIPFLAGSFKPSVSLGYHVSDHVYVGGIVQLRDVLERGTESFNAVNTGLGGIESTREETGARALIHARLRPHRYSPFLSVGAVFNASDREVMVFDDRRRDHWQRVLRRCHHARADPPWGIRPAVGFGYGYTFDSGSSWKRRSRGRSSCPRQSLRCGSTPRAT